MIIDLAHLPPGGLRSQGSEGSFASEAGLIFRDLTWELFLLPSGSDVYVDIQGRALWEGTCSRCLEPIDRTLAFHSQYLGSKDAELVARGSHTLGSQDLDVVFLPESQLDERSLVREQLELQIPMHPLCREDCQGLCPRCGKNWNKGRCSCPSPSQAESGALARALLGLRLNLEP